MPACPSWRAEILEFAEGYKLSEPLLPHYVAWPWLHAAAPYFAALGSTSGSAAKPCPTFLWLVARAAARASGCESSARILVPSTIRLRTASSACERCFCIPQHGPPHQHMATIEGSHSLSGTCTCEFSLLGIPSFWGKFPG